jgi:ribosome-binding protein aMBF1 (putative translation factor)
MRAKTCAACDSELDGDGIMVTLGGKVVEVCCDDCAKRLKEAHASAVTRRKG